MSLPDDKTLLKQGSLTDLAHRPEFANYELETLELKYHLLTTLSELIDMGFKHQWMLTL